ncbi:MAG: tetratricopeptide repeat protein, partial [bacterium]
SFLLPVMLGLLLGDRGGSWRILMTACIALALPSVFYTGSRGGLLALFTSIPVFTWLAYRTVYRGTASFWSFLRAVRWWVAAVAGVIVLVIALLPTSRNLGERFKEFLDPVRSSSIQTRFFYWYSGWLMGTDYHRTEMASPLAVAGSGIGAFHLAGARRQGQAQAIWDRKWPRAAEIVSPHLELYAHNDYVHLFAEIGPLGLGIFLWIMVALVVAGWSALARLPPGATYARWRLIGLLTAVVSYYVNSATNFPLKVIANAHVFFGCVVVAMVRMTALPVLTLPLPRWRLAGLVATVVAIGLSARGAGKVIASHYLKLGHAWTQAGDAARALDYFGKASRLAPIHTDAVLIHYYRGKALQNAGDLPAAIASFSAAIGVFEHFPEGLQGRGIAHSALAAQSAIGSSPYAEGVREGIGDLEKARALNPKDGLTVFFLGRAYRMAGAPAASVSPYLDAIKFSGEKIPDAFYELALSYVELKRTAEARAVLEALMARFQSAAPAAARQLLAQLGPAPRKR